MKKTRTIISGITLISLILTMGMASAVHGASPKIGYIDTQRVLRESKAAQDARNAIVEDLKQKQAVYQAKEQEVLRMQQDYAKERDALSKEIAKDRQEILSKSIKELKRLKVDLEEELNKKHREMTETILREVAEIIKDFRSEKDYTLLFERKNIISADPDIDVTDEIIRIYDQKNK